MKLTEDDLYRTSTQYRLWSFTPAQLATQREKTNQQATERVKANVARQRAARASALNADTPNASDTGSGVDTNGGNTPLRGVDVPVGGPQRGEKPVDCLTVEEEKRLVDTFCSRALELGGFLNLRTEVTSTGIQFLRRFYLYNSPMTYEPQTISRCAMFLAAKCENQLIPVSEYVSHFPKGSTESVLAPEYLLVQGLRFNFNVRHPFQGLRGAHLEMLEMARGNASLLEWDRRTEGEVQNAMMQLPKQADGEAQSSTVTQVEKRIQAAYTGASKILKGPAQLTDAYFLYTPSQIWLSAHLLADEPLTLFYLSTKVPSTTPIYTKLLSTLRSCAALISAHHSYASERTSKAEKDARDKKEKEEVSALIKKLRHCRDPDKIDLVKLNAAQKRDAVADGALEESKAKRRKMAREDAKKEADDFWGPELKSKETLQE